MRPLNRALWQRLSPLLDRALDLDRRCGASFWPPSAPSDPDIAAALEALLAEHQRVAGLRLPRSAAARRRLRRRRWPGRPSAATRWSGRSAWAAWERCGWRGGATAGSRGTSRSSSSTWPCSTTWRRSGSAAKARSSRGCRTRTSRASSTPASREAGQPFLVLEYVEGTRIDRYAAERRLGVAARLELFLQVADAVAHAHANLVVHRDLKPSNVLVDRTGRSSCSISASPTLLEARAGRRALDAHAGGRPRAHARTRRARAGDRRRGHHRDRRLRARRAALSIAVGLSSDGIRRWNARGGPACLDRAGTAAAERGRAAAAPSGSRGPAHPDGARHHTRSAEARVSGRSRHHSRQGASERSGRPATRRSPRWPMTSAGTCVTSRSPPSPTPCATGFASSYGGIGSRPPRRPPSWPPSRPACTPPTDNGRSRNGVSCRCASSPTG